MSQSQQQKDIEKALALAEKAFGIKLETSVEELLEDKMREAESVYLYFSTKGKPFKRRNCDVCGLIFAYCYEFDGIKSCSVTCMAKKLAKIGLKWDALASVERRWGRAVPAIVPPKALEILDEVL